MGCDAYLDKLRKDCNNLVVKLHTADAMNDELLLQLIGMKCKGNSFHKVNGALRNVFRCSTPAYAHPLFKTQKLTPENLLNVNIKDIPVR